MSSANTRGEPLGNLCRRALVTGGAGFVGRHLVALLAAHGIEVVVLDRRVPPPAGQLECSWVVGDVRDTDLVLEVLEHNQINLAFHLAAQPIVPAAALNPRATVSVNVSGTAAVAEAVHRAGSRVPLVFASSGAVYGAPSSDEPLPEGALAGPSSIYGATKRAGEEILRGYSDSCGITVVVCRLMNTYGPGDTHLSRLVPRGVDLLSRKAPYHFGDRDDGTSRLDFVYVADVAEALVAAGTRAMEGNGHEVFNVASGHATAVSDLARRLAKVAGRVDEPIFGGPPRARPYVKALEVTHTRQTLGWHAKTALHDGLALTWAAR